MRVEVAQLSGDGTIRRSFVETTAQDDSERWDRLVAEAKLSEPPPYRPEPGEPVYEVQAGARVAQVAERDLTGPLRELVTSVLAEGTTVS